ncbi:MAG TPA: hypothetical protein VFP15_07015, partial [Gemmatimonadaceae bacterium]|nr:hypothetical protein [Gemmatimonadaceae bacterium]
GQGFRKQARDRMLVLRVPVPDGGVLLAEGPPVDVQAFKTRVASCAGASRRSSIAPASSPSPDHRGRVHR